MKANRKIATAPALSAAADDSEAERRRRAERPRWFSPVPVAMLLDSSISNDAKVLAGILIHYNGPAGCYPKVETLMRDLNSSKSTTLRLLEELERYGFLVRDRRGRNNRYDLRPVYERPLRPDSFEATGQLAAQNAERPRPERRSALRKKRTAPQLPAPESREKVPPVTPIDIEKRPLARGPGQTEKVSSVTPIVEIEPPKIPEQVSPVIPESVSPTLPISVDGCHPCDLDRTKNQTEIKNHQHQDESTAEETDDGGDKKRGDLRSGLAALQRAGVNVDARDIGTHLGRDRKLDDGDLLAWATWVATTPAPDIAKKPGFAASKIRMGCTLEDAFPNIGIQTRRREETRAAAAAAADDERNERERAARADALMAALPQGERAKLRELALDDGGIRAARNASQSLRERLILATERRLVLHESQPGTIARDHSTYPELPPL
jgi:hypothetical protein